MQSSLLSTEFLGLALAAALLLTGLAGVLRSLAFLAVNLLFVCGLLLEPAGAVSTVAFCLLGYGILRVVQRFPRIPLGAALGVYITVFVYLREYTFLKWVLPERFFAGGAFATVGLSFLFFKVLHVLIEARSGTLGPLSFLGYVNYCLNFTTFMMGPIQRYQDFRGQWTGETKAIPTTLEAHLDAVLRVVFGLICVYVVADRIEPYALSQTPDVLKASAAQLWIRAVYFFFFLYINFSGYCSVAIGVGSLMGIRPPENFQYPYLARNISDFWLRFHRSLTLWLTSYVFTPAYKAALERNFFGPRPLLAQNGALLLTMLVSGLWHGTTPAFLVFGLMHGTYFVLFRTWEHWAQKRLGKPRLRAIRANPFLQALSIVATLAAVSLSLVFFRLDLQVALPVVGRMFGL